MNGIVDIFRVSAGCFLKLPKVADLVSTLAFLWASKTFVRSISPNGEMAAKNDCKNKHEQHLLGCN